MIPRSNQIFFRPPPPPHDRCQKSLCLPHLPPATFTHIHFTISCPSEFNQTQRAFNYFLQINHPCIQSVYCSALLVVFLHAHLEVCFWLLWDIIFLRFTCAPENFLSTLKLSEICYYSGGGGGGVCPQKPQQFCWWQGTWRSDTTKQALNLLENKIICSI